MGWWPTDQGRHASCFRVGVIACTPLGRGSLIMTASRVSTQPRLSEKVGRRNFRSPVDDKRRRHEPHPALGNVEGGRLLPHLSHRWGSSDRRPAGDCPRIYVT
jgi:hypothetical protein